MVKKPYITTKRENMSYDTELGKHYLLLRRKSLLSGLSKSSTIPYVLKYIDTLSALNNNIPHIVDVGCSEGDILNEINNLTKDKVKSLTGIDYNVNIIKKAKEKYPGIEFIRKDLVQDSFDEFSNHVDIALAINTLHEIFSFYATNGAFDAAKGVTAVLQAIGKIKDMLRKDGIFILFDGIEQSTPKDKLMRIRLKNKKVEANLQKFMNEYIPYKVEITKIDESIYEISSRDFTRFITKYRFLHSVDWHLEREESYQYFNKMEFIQNIKTLGFKVETLNLLSPNLGTWADSVEILTEDESFPYEHILIIGRKIK